MSKTLLFTTSYCPDNDVWEKRLYEWYNYFSSSSLVYDKLLILDDSSPILPAWNNVLNITEPFNNEPVEKNLLIRFKTHLGRPSMLNYPGWFRSFSFAAKYAIKFNYSKIIHIESDAYIVSEKLFNYVNNLNKGWVSLWCNLYKFPETAIQIICKDQIANYYNITQLPYEKYFINSPIENMIPFTLIEKQFIGDRYFEYQNYIPKNADYSCQSLVPTNNLK